MQKIKKIIAEIKKYQHSNDFKDKLNTEIEKDKSFDINKQYNNLIEYFDKYNKSIFNDRLLSVLENINNRI